MIILAIGQVPDLSFIPRDIKINERGTIHVDPVTLETSLPGIFAGGDVVAGTLPWLRRLPPVKKHLFPLTTILRENTSEQEET